MSQLPFGRETTPDWSALLGRLATLSAPGRGAHLVVLAAHPDDESLGAGGLIAAAAASGASITVIVASDGEASHPNSVTHRPHELASRRCGEVHAAVAALAPRAELHLLGLPDGRIAERIDTIADRVSQLQPAPTHVISPWSGDRHPDHAACAEAARIAAGRVAARHWQYPIWAWHWDDPDSPSLPTEQLRALPLDHAVHAAKQRAIGCHASQHHALSPASGDEPIIGASMLAHFRQPVEVFVIDAVSSQYFDQLYRTRDDPWQLADRFYEQRKRAALLAALPRRRYRRAFEPGCATGLLTAELACRCDEVVAWDGAGAAVAQSRRHLRTAAHVDVRLGSIPTEWPTGCFDLIVLSEVAYYCHDLVALRERIDASLDPDGLLIACHWRHPAPLHPHTAETVHEILGSRRRPVVSHVEDDFLLHAWSSRPISVAAEEGIR